MYLCQQNLFFSVWSSLREENKVVQNKFSDQQRELNCLIDLWRNQRNYLQETASETWAEELEKALAITNK